jgi:hypothetical protein
MLAQHATCPNVASIAAQGASDGRPMDWSPFPPPLLAGVMSEGGGLLLCGYFRGACRSHCGSRQTCCGALGTPPLWLGIASGTRRGGGLGRRPRTVCTCIFGDSWKEAGTYAQILVLAALVMALGKGLGSVPKRRDMIHCSWL